MSRKRHLSEVFGSNDGHQTRVGLTVRLRRAKDAKALLCHQLPDL